MNPVAVYHSMKCTINYLHICYENNFCRFITINPHGIQEDTPIKHADPLNRDEECFCTLSHMVIMLLNLRR